MSEQPLRGRCRWAYGFFEPLAFHRRVGLWWRAGPKNVDSWYIRGHSEKTAEKLSKLGVNLVTTNFFKGYGIENPEEDIERSKEFISFCHKWEIKALVYIQFRSIMPETFLKETPEAANWACRDPDGKIVTFGNAHWRWQPCPNEPEFIAYIKKVIKKALIEARADGIHLDNFFLPRNACYCDRCKDKFREYLKGKYSEKKAEKVLGTRDFDFVEPPPSITTWDALCREWICFKCTVMEKTVKDMRDFIKSTKPDAIFAGHPSYGWNMAGNYFLEKSIGPELTDKYLDMVIAENLNFPRISKNGQLVSMIREYKMGLTNNCVTIPFAFIPPEEEPEYRSGGGITAVPRSKQVKLGIAESAAFGGHASGGMWVTAPYKNKYAFEDSRIGKNLKSYYDFLIKYENYYRNIRSAAKVAVLRSTNSLAYTFDQTGPCLLGIEQVLIQGHIPFQIIFDHHLRELPKYSLLILPNVTCMSDEQVRIVKEYVRDGGKLVAIGNTSLYDQNYRYREEYGLGEVLRVSFFDDVRPSFVKNIYGKGESLYLSETDFPSPKEQLWKGEPRSFVPQLPANWRRMIEEIRMLNWDFSLDISADKNVTLDFFKQENTGKFLLHLVNYDLDEIVKNIDVRMNLNLLEKSRIGEVLCVSPDENKEIINFEAKDNYLEFRIPRLDVYNLIVISPPPRER